MEHFLRVHTARMVRSLDRAGGELGQYLPRLAREKGHSLRSLFLAIATKVHTAPEEEDFDAEVEQLRAAAQEERARAEAVERNRRRREVRGGR